MVESQNPKDMKKRIIEIRLNPKGEIIGGYHEEGKVILIQKTLHNVVKEGECWLAQVLEKDRYLIAFPIERIANQCRILIPSKKNCESPRIVKLIKNALGRTIDKKEYCDYKPEALPKEISELLNADEFAYYEEIYKQFDPTYEKVGIKKEEG